MKTIKARAPGTVSIVIDEIPQYQNDAMCKILIGCVNRFFENPAVKADYERWKKAYSEREGVSR